MKKIFLRILLFTPLSLLLILSISIGIHFFNLKTTTQDFETDLEKYYQTETWARPDIVSQIHLINEKSIVALGESSLIVPGDCGTSSFSPHTFPQLLNQALKKTGHTVHNLGYCGDDSRGVLGEVRYLLSQVKPKAFLFYFGHNDFSNASRDLLHRKTAFINSDWILRKIFFFLSPGLKFQLDHIERNVVEAMIVRIFRSINPEYFSIREYRHYSALINEKIVQNVNAIVELCNRYKVKAIILTPVGNILYPPVAAEDSILKIYQHGLKQDLMDGLFEAAENDYFGYDQRAKKVFINHLKTIQSDNILIVNLDEEIRLKKSLFFKTTFSDIFHFTEQGHAWVYSQLIKSGSIEFLL